MLSIIIPTFNRNDSLTTCLELLHYTVQGLDENSYEIIVTDDSLNNLAKEIVEGNFKWVRWVQGPKRGPAANRNNGANHSMGDWLIFIDDDCMPDRNLIKSYLAAINVRSENQFVFEGKIIPNRQQERFDEEIPINLNGGCLWSCNFCIEKKLFFKIGLFDEMFPYPSMEDADLNERLNKDYSIIFLEEAFVIHPWRPVVFFAQFKKRMTSFQFFVRKHYSNSLVSFRISRIKIFFYSLVKDFILLGKLKFKGTLYYFEKCIFNFASIFL